MTNILVDSRFDEVWISFQRDIKSDDDAADALYQSLIDSNQTICGCSFLHFSHKRGARFYTCRSCKSDFWFTSGTALDGVVRLRAWLAAIFFKDHGFAISAARLSRLVDVAPSTAQNIHKTLALVICDEMPDAETVSANWFSQIIFKRSRQTPAECHPRTELLEQASAYAQDFFSEYSSGHLDDNPLASNYREIVRDLNSAPPNLKLAVAQFVGLISSEFHGISKKCLQLYLASFWCSSDRVRWAPGVLLQACLRHTPIRYEQILNFISPSRVVIVLPPS
ncbi:MAG: hypothetical protein Q8T09_18085 [Candidatus Melainabacteria bacterium]|nr:hypothetical protein [Candidatus Melainabacteria bacterium]